jgi:hypothetical protein
VSPSTTPDALPVRTYLEEGARIAAILLIWGVLAAFATFVIGNFGYRSSIIAVVGGWLGTVLGLVGVLNAVLYVVFRAIDYWQA